VLTSSSGSLQGKDGNFFAKLFFLGLPWTTLPLSVGDFYFFLEISCFFSFFQSASRPTLDFFFESQVIPLSLSR